MLADRAPKPDARSLVRRLPALAPPIRAATAPGASSPAAPAPSRAAAQQPRPEPLGGERYKVSFTASAETHAKLDEARALLRHQIPDGDLARLFDRALDALLRETRRTKFAQRSPGSARPGSSEPATRHIPAAIKRAVAERDRHRCTFVAPDGTACGSREWLEFHHLEPFARSRRHGADAITLRCRAHNRHAALLDYGADHMAPFRNPPTAPTRASPPCSGA